MADFQFSAGMDARTIQGSLAAIRASSAQTGKYVERQFKAMVMRPLGTKAWSSMLDTMRRVGKETEIGAALLAEYKARQDEIVAGFHRLSELLGGQSARERELAAMQAKAADAAIEKLKKEKEARVELGKSLAEQTRLLRASNDVESTEAGDRQDRLKISNNADEQRIQLNKLMKNMTFAQQSELGGQDLLSAIDNQEQIGLRNLEKRIALKAKEQAAADFVVRQEQQRDTARAIAIQEEMQMRDRINSVRRGGDERNASALEKELDLNGRLRELNEDQHLSRADKAAFAAGILANAPRSENDESGQNRSTSIRGFGGGFMNSGVGRQAMGGQGAMARPAAQTSSPELAVLRGITANLAKLLGTVAAVADSSRRTAESLR